MTFVSAGPLHGRIRLGDELRDRFARRTQAASSSVLRYSRPDRRVLAMPSQSTSPATARCLLASAAIRLASNTKAAPVTNPSAIQRCTTVSNSLRSRSQSQNCLFLERVKWSGHLAVEAADRTSGRPSSGAPPRATAVQNEYHNNNQPAASAPKAASLRGSAGKR
jgi:hypothetical protein